MKHIGTIGLNYGHEGLIQDIVKKKLESGDKEDRINIEEALMRYRGD